MENENYEMAEDNGYDFDGEYGNLSNNIPDIDTEAIVNSILDFE